MEILKATKKDINWIVRHRVEMFNDMTWSKKDLDLTETLVRMYLENSWNEQIICFLATDDEQIIGGCALSLFSMLPSSKTPSGNHGYIHNLFVEREYRNKGVATKLLEHTIRFCRENHVSKCWLHSTDASLSIYLKVGFEKCDNYYGLHISMCPELPE